MPGRAVGMRRWSSRVQGLAGAHLENALWGHRRKAPLRHRPLAAHALVGNHQSGAGPMVQQVTGQAALAQLQANMLLDESPSVPSEG